MTLVEWALAVLGIVVALGLVGLVGLGIATVLARKPDRAAVKPVQVEDLGEYFRRRAGFAVTVSARTPLSPEQISTRLLVRPYMSTLPFLSGPFWLDEERGVGSRRTMSGTVYSVSEQVILLDEGREIALTGTAVCTPATIVSFAERFRIEPTERDGVSEVTWTIAGTPRWLGFLPWRWGAPIARPVFAFVLRHVLRLGAFRPPRPTA